MKKKECIAMLLAGGQGSRLGALTKKVAKPAVSFGGKYKIIDFSLSNCANSGIDTVGVLTQYRPFILNSYISSGKSWDLSGREGGIFILPPYATESGGQWYAGTADSVYQNIEFMDIYDSEYVLILSGDHLYSMNYQDMLREHINNNADLTVSVIPVEWKEATRFGIITSDEEGKIVKFTEKPKKPDSNLASMGIYIFKKKVLVKALIEDSKDENSSHDFGKNIIPKLLEEGKRLFCYQFNGFWRDVGTIPEYYDTNMSFLSHNPPFALDEVESQVMSNSNIYPPQYIGADSKLSSCIVSNACYVLGEAVHSVLSTGCYVGEGASVRDSILLPGARVESGAVVRRAILGDDCVIESGVVIGSEDPEDEITVIGNNRVMKAK